MADEPPPEAAGDAEEAESEAEGQDEGETDEGEAGEGDAAAKGPPITVDEVFSLLMPSQNALDKRAARLEYLKQLKAADQEACQKAVVIQELKQAVEEMEKKKPMTPEESALLDQKQQELFNMLQEFEEITKKVHELAALAELDSKSSFQISPYDQILGPPLPTSAILNFNLTSTGVQAPVKMEDTLEFVPPKEKLPKMVICGTGDWPPKIVVCEDPYKPKDKTTRGTNTDSQVILKLKNEVKKTKSGSQIPVKKIYGRLKNLNQDILDVEQENAQLTKKLLQLLQEDPNEGKALQASKGQVAEDEISGEGLEIPGEGGLYPESAGEGSLYPESLGEGSLYPESPGEGSIAQEVSAEKVKASVQQPELPMNVLPSVPNCTCGRRANAFSLEFELTKIETEVQRMLTEIDCATNPAESKSKKPAVVIGSCNIAALYNPP